MSVEWKQNDPEMAKCMLNFLLDELQPQLWTKKKDAIATFTSYYFRSNPIYSDQHIITMFMGDATRRGLLQACGQISWKSFRIKTSSIRSLDLLVDLLDDIKNKESEEFVRVFLSMEDAAFEQMKLDKLLTLKETKAKATTLMNLLQANGRQVPVSNADDFVDSAVPKLLSAPPIRQLADSHRDSVLVEAPTAPFVPRPVAVVSKSQFVALMAKLSSLLSRRPNISSLMEKGIVQTPRAFGRSITDVVSLSNIAGVPTFFVICCDYLRETALDKVGLFRVSGEQAEVFRIKRMIDYEADLHVDDELSPHSVAGIIKLWVRELPEPLLTFELYDALVKNTRDECWEELDRLEQSIPQPNLRIFRYLCSFLADVSLKSDLNKMTPSNLAIVFAPNLIRPIIETFEAIARDTPITIATIRYFIEKACKSKSVGGEPAATADVPITDLPADWTVYLDETTGAPFFYNTVTNESCWDRPTDIAPPRPPDEPNPSATKKASPGVLPPGWVEFCDDDSGSMYYYNQATDECSWVLPTIAPKEPFDGIAFQELAFSRVISGRWDDDTAGGAFPEISWFRNPQWLTQVAGSGAATFRVSLACATFNPIGVHIFAVPSNRTADEGRLLTLQSEDQILSIGPFHDDETGPIQQATIEIEITRPTSLMIIPATSVPGLVGEFRLSISCDVPISITEILDTGVWHKLVINSEWTETSAGGCYPNFATWRDNNQFKLSATNTSLPVRILAHLERKHSGPDVGAIGIYILANNGPAEEKIGVSDGDVLARSEFVTANDVGVEAVLPGNVLSSSGDALLKHAVVIPCTYEPGIVDSFTLTVYADAHVSLSPVLQRWHSSAMLTSRWTSEQSGGCRNYDSWQTNPSFVLSSTSERSSWQAMCILSQPDPERVLPIGFYVTDVKGKTRCKGTFSLAPEVFGQMTFRKQEQPYTLFACTFHPSLLGEFRVQVFSAEACELQTSARYYGL